MTIGIRAHWTCAECSLTATTQHIERIFSSPRRESKAGIVLDLPQGWTVRDGASYCPDHTPTCRRR
jgi:hypothetical protein